MKQLTEHIAFAGEEQFQEITDLWIEAFGDEKEYVQFYLKHRFTADNMLIYIENDKVVSMLTLLPLTLYCGEEQVAAKYVYAVATKKDCRRRGYAAELLSYAHETYGTLVLEPAGEALAQYYCRMGFREAFFVREYELAITDEQTEHTKYWLLSITPSEYADLRDRYFMGEGYCQWERDGIAYALLENDFCGGYAYKILHNGQEDLLLYRMEEGKLRIIETTLTDAAICDVCRKLKLPVTKASVRRNAPDGGKMLGMLWSKAPVTGGYLNLTLE